MQVFASDTVTVYVPAARPDAVAPGLPESDNEYVNPQAHPDGVILEVQFELPLQDTFG